MYYECKQKILLSPFKFGVLLLLLLLLLYLRLYSTATGFFTEKVTFLNVILNTKEGLSAAPKCILQTATSNAIVAAAAGELHRQLS